MATRKAANKRPGKDVAEEFADADDGAAEQDLAREYHSLRLAMAEKYWMPKVREGDIYARRQVLIHILEAISECGFFPPQVSQFAAQGLERIANDKGDLSAPFGIRRNRGQKRHFKSQEEKYRRYLRAYKVECQIHSGAGVEQAIASVAEAEGVPEDTVKSAWGEFFKPARQDIALQVKHLGRVITIK